MTRANDNRVRININVVVDGVRMPQPHELAQQRGHPEFGLGILLIDQPPSSTATSPANTLDDGNGCIAANGTSPYASTQAVWGLAYNNLAPVYPTSTRSPSAVQGTLYSDGSWSFSAAAGNLVPGALFDSNFNGPDNSTLVIWYQYQSGTTLVWGYEPGHFHGYRPGGSGSGPGIAAIPAHPRIKARTLHAGFTRGLARLGSVALKWDGVSWVGQSSDHGGCILSFQCNDSVCQLQAGGPAVAFIAAGRPNSFKPFHWSATGTAFGALTGDFAVQITE
jgi:hypothetical protein